MSEFPCPVPPKPPIARKHCRHYHYEKALGSPTCSGGVPTEEMHLGACMPVNSGVPSAFCALRKEWTEAERATWRAWQDHSMQRLLICAEVIPSGKDAKGRSGTVPCPACGTGTIQWSRAPNNHLAARCSTKNCFQVMQ